MYPELTRYIEERITEFEKIAQARHAELARPAGFVEERIRSGRTADLIYICTHNSRRSHLAQVWAQTAATWYEVPGVHTYSGGTEATAFHPHAVSALAEAGFHIDREEGETNPVYRVRFSAQAEPMICFSKVYDEDPNPGKGFCAVMTCSEADQNCPTVGRAAQRVSLPYDDPKAFDGTDQEAVMYQERCRQIAREMLCSFSMIDTR